jgi:hypothetical protein
MVQNVPSMDQNEPSMVQKAPSSFLTPGRQAFHLSARRRLFNMATEMIDVTQYRDEAGALAGEAADTFARAGARLHLSTALSYLREAVQHRAATLELVQYVREYVMADEEGRRFEPPSQIQ